MMQLPDVVQAWHQVADPKAVLCGVNRPREPANMSTAADLGLEARHLRDQAVVLRLDALHLLSHPPPLVLRRRRASLAVWSIGMLECLQHLGHSRLLHHISDGGWVPCCFWRTWTTLLWAPGTAGAAAGIPGGGRGGGGRTPAPPPIPLPPRPAGRPRRASQLGTLARGANAQGAGTMAESGRPARASAAAGAGGAALERQQRRQAQRLELHELLLAQRPRSVQRLCRSCSMAVF